jgi:hypothetical protein
MKTYSTFIFENKNMNLVDIRKMTDGNLHDIEVELKKKFMGRRCVWYERGNRTRH